MNWLEQWRLNYTNQSPEAKELKGKLKKTYKKDLYVPWATMVRLMMAQDPDSHVDVILNTKNNTPLYTASDQVYQDDGTTETTATMMVHFVIVRCTFMGKTFEEVYPVQDTAYDARKVVDQNMVNKALQRAKAKAISTATGIAFQLYEDGDLQFDADDTPAPDTTQGSGATVVIPAPVAPVVPPVVVVPEPTKTDVMYTDDTKALADYIKSKYADLVPEIQKLNTTLVAKFGISLLESDTLDMLCAKISKMSNPNTTLTALKTMRSKRT